MKKIEPIENIEPPVYGDGDPFYMYRIIDKINEIIKAINK